MFAEGDITICYYDKMKKYLEDVKRYFDEKQKGDAIQLSKIQRNIRGLADEMNRESQTWAAKIKVKDEQIEGAQVKMNEMQTEIDSLKRETQSLREARASRKIVLNRKNETEKRDSISPMKDDSAIGTSAIRRIRGPSSPSLAGRFNTGPYKRSTLSSHPNAGKIRRPITFDRSPSHGRFRSTTTFGYAAKRCPKCDRRFPTLKQYSIHVLHICVKPFQCHLCDRTLTTSQTLRNHMNTHSDEL